MASAARELQGEEDVQTTLDKAVALALANVRGCDAAALSFVHARRKVETPASTEALAFDSDQLQYQIEEGPCLDAIWEQQVVHSPDLARDERWPSWGPTVAERTGARSILCFRLFTQQDTVGALNLYSRTRSAFDEQDRDEGLAMAAHIAVAVAGARRIEQLTESVDTRTVIGQAQGIIMERFAVDAATAFRVLGRISSHSNTKLRRVAEDVVSTREIPGASSPR